MKYDGLIKKIYYDPAGFGTVQETYKDAKKVDSSIFPHIYIIVLTIKIKFHQSVYRLKRALSDDSIGFDRLLV